MATDVLRFAPSPTGGLHVGNARTAIFNYLYARRYGATLRLRVEDTDKERSTEASLGTILDGLSWLGVACEGETVFQSRNADAHSAAANRLIESGAAYACVCTADELDAIRKQAQKDGKGARFPAATPDEVREATAAGNPPVTYFRIPDGETVWDDGIRGESRWDNSVISDFAIVRSDGSPMYNVAVVVDDHDMGVTLVLRGADHISNTPKQIALFKALGWDVPRYAHSTLLLGDDGKKLSKRHGATTVPEYRDRGFQPEAVFNFLALLGWAPGDGREVFTPDELAEAFSTDGLLKKDSVFDEKKLQWLNGEHIRAKSPAGVLQVALPEWIDEGLVAEADIEEKRETLTHIARMLQPRVEFAADFRKADYFFRDPVTYDEAGLKKQWKADTPERMASYIERLRELDPWTEGGVEGVTRMLAGELNLSPARLIHPTRLLLCGVGHGPGLFELMGVLGKETCLDRLTRGLEAVAGMEKEKA